MVLQVPEDIVERALWKGLISTEQGYEALRLHREADERGEGPDMVAVLAKASGQDPKLLRARGEDTIALEAVEEACCMSAHRAAAPRAFAACESWRTRGG
ncbi:MAG: hypothetical protein ACYTFT_04130 [Planctomycetota bacterium]|jgi:hypothetical protein